MLVIPMERDTPWTDWSRMLQLRLDCWCGGDRLFDDGGGLGEFGTDEFEAWRTDAVVAGV